MSTTSHPVAAKLNRAACERILSRNHVGRSAYACANHYRHRAGPLRLRTQLALRPDVGGREAEPESDGVS
jgi:hypothetical protein